MNLDLTLDVWNVLAVLFAAGVLWGGTRAELRSLRKGQDAIVRKLDDFITKDSVEEKERTAEAEHDSIRSEMREERENRKREVNGLTRRVETLER